MVAIIFLLVLIAYIKKRRAAGKMSPHENKMSSYGRLWLYLMSVFWSTKELLLVGDIVHFQH